MIDARGFTLNESDWVGFLYDDSTQKWCKDNGIEHTGVYMVTSFPTEDCVELAGVEHLIPRFLIEKVSDGTQSRNENQEAIEKLKGIQNLAINRVVGPAITVDHKRELNAILDMHKEEVEVLTARINNLRAIIKVELIKSGLSNKKITKVLNNI